MKSARGQTHAQARVIVSRGPLWAFRLRRDGARWFVFAAVATAMLLTVRSAVAPPVAAVDTSRGSTHGQIDRGAEAFATLFARRYLTWDAGNPVASARMLEPYFGTGVEPGAGIELPSNGSQTVQWAEVAQAGDRRSGGHDYTVAVQTDRTGLIYLEVSVIRSDGGRLSLAGYPAFVGPPGSAASHSAADMTAVSDPALVTVVRRALRNYLGRAQSELAADLVTGAQVSLPTQPLVLEALQEPYWSAQHEVLAVVQARDSRGAQYTLGYELAVVRDHGRWEVSQFQVNPDA